MEAGWHAGIDPGAQTALTVGLVNSKSGELKHLAIHYEFLEKSLTKLEKLQQALSLKQGPRRKRTETEIQEACACSHALRGNTRGAMFRVVNE